MSDVPTRPRLQPVPSVLRTRPWADYALLDSGDGKKLERYGDVTVIRPEPQCWWTPRSAVPAWSSADAVFDPTGDEDEGRWRTTRSIPPAWPIRWGEVSFKARLTPFRHLAFFPEQGANWAYLDERIRAASGSPRVLNLFGYTGVASLVAAAAGASVTHVDASKKAVAWARENAEASNLSDRPIRWICEDARRYVQREIKRGSTYHGIILDPPKYGRGPGGEVWRVYEDLAGLLNDCVALLAADADFLVLNAYAARVSGLSLAHLMAEALDGRGGSIEWGELALAEEDVGEGLLREVGLSFFARWRPAP